MVPIMGRVPVLPGLDLALTPELRFILDLGVALALALVFGALATRLGQPPIVGYLAAGVVIGPFTPGFVGDQEQIGQLAELGVVLLLFALGVEFSLHELRRVWRIAVPGAIAQIVITAVAGAAVVDPARDVAGGGRPSSGPRSPSAPRWSCSRSWSNEARWTASTVGRRSDGWWSRTW